MINPYAQASLITFATPDATDVTVNLDDPGVSVTSDSFGGWDFVDRPNNSPVPIWRGYPAFSLSIPILFDQRVLRLTNGSSGIETRIANLELLAGRGKGAGGSTKPPAITIRAVNNPTLIPHNDPDKDKWLITALEWGDSLRDSDGARTRQAGVVSVSRYADPNVKVKSAPKRAGHARAHKTHIVKAGETLVKISSKEYGSPDRWQDIARANDIHDPRHLRVGARLKLPT